MPSKLLLVLLLTTSAAWAEWAQVGETDHSVLYIKPASIRRHGNLVTVSQLTDYKERQNTGGISLQTTIEYDCQQSQYRFPLIRRHAEPMGVGATLLETLRQVAEDELLAHHLMFLVSALSRRRWAPQYGLRRCARSAAGVWCSAGAVFGDDHINTMPKSRPPWPKLSPNCYRGHQTKKPAIV